MSYQPPCNLPDLSGSATLTTSPLQLFPYTWLNAKAPSFVIWVSNDGPNPVTIQLVGSPDAINPVTESIETVPCPVGEAVKLQRDNELLQWWTVNVTDAVGGSKIRWGVMIPRNTAF